MSTKHSLKLVLNHSSGQQLYPCLMKDRNTGKIAFRVTPPGGGNKKAKALQVSESEMIDYVKNHKYKVRCSTLPHLSGHDEALDGLYALDGHSILSYKFSL